MEKYIFDKLFRTLLLTLFFSAFIGIVIWSDRTHFWSVLIPFSTAFAALIWMQNDKRKLFHFHQWFWWGVIFRLIFLFYTPEWSDDVYRFIWDGKLLHESIHPYLYLPNELNEIQQKFPDLFLRMNSAGYYSVYPPVLQGVFFLGSVFEETAYNIVVLRLVVIFFEVGTFVLFRKLLLHFKLPEKRIWWYFLNPLVIVELTGNLHMEGIMLFFILLALWLIVQRKMVGGGMVFGLAVATKLLPLVFLPFLVKLKGWRGSFVFCLGVLGTLTLLFLPFLDKETLLKMGSSLNLYFQTFEFNASFYYVLREIGFLLLGFNAIQWIGPGMAFLSLVLILSLSLKVRREVWPSFFTYVVLGLTLYFLGSTTVHPWYVVTILGLSVLSTFKYPIIWSYLVILSYCAYSQPDFQENYWSLGIEYVLLFLFIFLEANGTTIGDKLGWKSWRSI